MKKKQTKEELFARAYLANGLNATEAATTIGLAKKSAHVEGSKYLRKPKVQRLLAELSKQHAEKLDISADRILLQLARVAFFDIRKIFDDQGQLKPISDLDEDTAAAIAGLDHDHLFEYFGKGQRKHVGNTVKVRMADKIKALELLGKYRKLFTDKIELGADDALVQRLLNGRKRVSLKETA
jgi:phage terminase small subunit